jgi:multidrug efflux pump subunit AcrA (membrane-fusion protein)
VAAEDPVEPGQELEQESELLPREPPPQALRVMTDVVLGLFLVTATFVAVVRLPATITGRFELKPESGSDPVNAPWEATVESVEVVIGDQVEKGDTLLVLRSEALRQLASEKATLERDLVADRQRLEALLEDPGTASASGDVSELRARVARLEREMEIDTELAVRQERQDEVRLANAKAQAARRGSEVRERKNRAEALDELQDMTRNAHEQGVLPKRQVLEASERQEDARAELEEARTAHEAASAELRAIEAEREVDRRVREIARRDLEGRLAEARGALQDEILRLSARVASSDTRLTYLTRALEGADGDLLRVVAPYTGMVASMDVERPGVAVARGQVLCELARRNVTLAAHLQIPESEAARVETGQFVRLLFDAYPYTRHGVKAGVLTWVSPRARGGKIEAIAQLWDDNIVVDGVRRPLRPGLVGEARVRTGKHSLLEYVLAPLREFRESVAPENQERGGPPPGVRTHRPAAEPAGAATPEGGATSSAPGSEPPVTPPSEVPAPP